jgi:hypothetical protein
MSLSENPASNPTVDSFEPGIPGAGDDSTSGQAAHLLISRLADHTAELRAASRSLGDRIEQFARLVATRRAG